MFCPICESEYNPGITHCPDDNAELVERLGTESGATDDSVRAAVQGGASDAFSPVFSAVSPGVAVLVDERDLDRAREIYASFFGDDTSPLTGPASGDSTEEDVEAE